MSDFNATKYTEQKVSKFYKHVIGELTKESSGDDVPMLERSRVGYLILSNLSLNLFMYALHYKPQNGQLGALDIMIKTLRKERKKREKGKQK